MYGFEKDKVIKIGWEGEYKVVKRQKGYIILIKTTNPNNMYRIDLSSKRKLQYPGSCFTGGGQIFTGYKVETTKDGGETWDLYSSGMDVNKLKSY
jgi:hypothetical protein